MRKLFKNFIACMLFVCLLCSISSCTPRRYSYRLYEELVISSVQLIQYDNPTVEAQEYQFILVAKYPFETFDEDKCTVIEELPSEHLEEFKADLCEIIMGVSEAKFRGHNGQGIRITYTDGTYYVATWYTADGYWEGYAAHVAMYDTDGTIVENSCNTIGGLPYMTVAANYFQTKIQ